MAAYPRFPGRRRWTIALASGVSVFALAFPAVASAGAPARPDPMATLKQALQALVSHPDGPPGAIVAIGGIQGGKQVPVRIVTAGVADLSTGALPQAGDHMRIASVSKAFNGATVLSLVASKRLKLSDTVGRWLPGMPKPWHPVTLAQLLNHTSGIPDFTSAPGFLDALVKSPQDAPPPLDLPRFAPTALSFKPGTQYHYSNTENILAALMTEAATSRSYESLLASQVTKPFDLTGTTLPHGIAVPAPTMRGYDAQPPHEDLTTVVAAGWVWSSGGVISTPTDLVHFIAHYVRGDETNAKTRAAQFTFRPGSSEPGGPGTNSAGLGIFRYQTSCGTVYGHTGNFFGYTQFIAATADGRHAVAVSVNAQLSENLNSAHFPELRHIFELAVCAAR